MRAAGSPMPGADENSSENGTRNFSDASSQIQWRSAALLARNASVINQAPPQNSVDCHRWLISAAIICACPSRSCGVRTQQLLRVVDVFARNLAHLDQVGHDRPRVAAEQSEQLLEQARLHGSARGGGLEHVRVAYLLGAAHRAFDLEPVHHGLHGGVGGPVALDDGLVDLADGAGRRGSTAHP